MRARVLLAGLAGALSAPSGVHGATPLVEDTPQAACEVLKARVAELAGGRVDKYWYCEKGSEQKFLYVLALRSSRPGDGAQASNLVGWYAVARRSDVVLEWDIALDRLVPLAPAIPAHPHRHRSAGAAAGQRPSPPAATAPAGAVPR